MFKEKRKGGNKFEVLSWEEEVSQVQAPHPIQKGDACGKEVSEKEGIRCLPFTHLKRIVRLTAYIINDRRRGWREIE